MDCPFDLEMPADEYDEEVDDTEISTDDDHQKPPVDNFNLIESKPLISEFKTQEAEQENQKEKMSHNKKRWQVHRGW